MLWASPRGHNFCKYALSWSLCVLQTAHVVLHRISQLRSQAAAVVTLPLSCVQKSCGAALSLSTNENAHLGRRSAPR